MKDFSDYLKKFTLLLKGKVLQTEAIISVIKEVSGVQLEERNITFKNGVLFVSASSLAKNQIYMRKEKILQSIKEKGVPDIIEIR